MNCRVRCACWLAAGLVAVASGCASVPPLDNPLLVRPVAGDTATADNPANRPGCAGYDEIYERLLDALDDDFEIIPGSRYSGEIRTYPKMAPGYEQPWKPGSPDPQERLEATLQAHRYFAIARIVEAQGGYRVTVEVYKEIEVVGQPLFALGGPSVFRSAPVADRTAEIPTGPRTADRQWVPAGPYPHRDFAFEQKILKKVLKPTGIK